jgi:plastocyanin
MEETQSQASEQSVKSPKSGFLVGVILLIIVGAGIYFFSSRQAGVQNKQVAGAKTVVSKTPTQSPTDLSAEKVFTVKGTSFAFNPNQLTVKKGEKVKIIFEDDGGFHDLVVDGYNIQTQKVTTGNTSEVEFVADKAGTFAYYCSVANHREKGMQGTLTVE